MIGSVVKAVDILNTFSSAEPRLSLAEISRRLDLPRSTAHNLLKTLLACELLEQDAQDRYALGPAIIALTQAVRVNVELRDRAAPLLRELADRCRESVYLTIRDGDYVLYIYAVESPRRLLARSAVGDRFHLHSTSVGKAILSGMSRAEIDGIVARVGLPAVNEKTLTDAAALHTEIDRCRARGFAIDAEENRRGIFCVGAPIFDAQQVIGACSISGADPAIVGSRLPELTSKLLFAAREISAWMGHVSTAAASTRTAGISAAPSAASNGDRT